MLIFSGASIKEKDHLADQLAWHRPTCNEHQHCCQVSPHSNVDNNCDDIVGDDDDDDGDDDDDDVIDQSMIS